MAASMVGSMVVLQILVASVVSEEWQPCQPYQPHQVNQANFTSWLSPSSHSTNVALQVQQLPWSADFTFMGKRFGVHPHPSHEDMMLIDFDGTQEFSPTQSFPINKWINIIFTRKEHLIEVEILTEHETFSILSRLSEVCNEAKVKIIQVTSVRLSLECPGVCVGQEADQDNHQKYLQGKKHTFFLLPKNNCQISLALEINNCAKRSKMVIMFQHRRQELGLQINVWNNVTIEYRKVQKLHGYYLQVNGKIIGNFSSREKAYYCHDVFGMVVKVEGLVLWSREGCDSSLYLDRPRKINIRNGCTATTTTTNKIKHTSRTTTTTTTFIPEHLAAPLLTVKESNTSSQTSADTSSSGFVFSYTMMNMTFGVFGGVILGVMLSMFILGQVISLGLFGDSFVSTSHVGQKGVTGSPLPVSA